MRKITAAVYAVLAAVIISLTLLPVSSADTDNPRVVMSAYTIGDGSSDTVSAGVFELHYTLSNPTSIGIVNAVISYDQKSSFIIPAPGSSNIENIGNIYAGSSYNGTLVLNIPKNVETGLCKLDFTVLYSSADPTVHSSLTSTFSIYVSIENNTELTLKNVELSDEAAAGGRKRLLIEYENPGSRDFRNLQLVIDGNISEQQKIQMLPMIKAGKSNSIEYYVQFTEIGEQNITVHIAYEDDEGNSYKTPLITKMTEVAEGGAGQTPSVTPSEGYISELIKKMKAFMETPEFAVIFIIMLALSAAAAVAVPRMRRNARKKTWYYKNNNNKNGG